MLDEEERGYRREAEKSQRRKKELPRKKERRERKVPEGAVGRTHGRLWKREIFEAENKLVKMRRANIHLSVSF